MRMRPSSFSAEYKYNEEVQNGDIFTFGYPRVYLSGPMAGIKYDNRPEFEYWKRYFLDQGCEVVSPFNIDHKDTSNRINTLIEDFTEEMVCDQIFFMRGWDNSRGCLAEWGYAMARGIAMLFEGPNRSVSYVFDPIPEDMQTDIMELDLSVRSFNCLKRAGINTYQDLYDFASKDPKWYMKVRHLGKRSHDEVVAQFGIKTGKDIL